MNFSAFSTPMTRRSLGDLKSSDFKKRWLNCGGAFAVLIALSIAERCFADLKYAFGSAT
jgi:hypothetical protein